MKRKKPAEGLSQRLTSVETKSVVRRLFYAKCGDRNCAKGCGMGGRRGSAVSKWLMTFVCIGVLLSASSCQSNQQIASSDKIKKATYFDYQTRYQAENTLGGFRLTVYHNARGRSLGHAAVATLYDLTQKIARQHAGQNKRDIQQITMNDLSISALYDEKTRTHYWQADTRVDWVMLSE